MPTEPTAGDIQAIASAISVLRPDEMVLETWSGAMASGAYKFGQGCLRSADDEYDALGVLAALQVDVDWTWDEHDECWAANGDAYAIDPVILAGWLGIDEPQRLVANHLQTHANLLIDTITKASDNVTSFDAVIKMIRGGIERSKSERRRLEEVSISDLRTLGGRGVVGQRESIGMRPGMFYRR